LGAIAPRYVVHTSFDIVEPCDIHVFVLYSTHLGDDALSYFHYSEADLSPRRAPTLPEASHGAKAPLELIRVEISPLRPGTRGDEGAPQEALAILLREAQLSRLGGRPREIIDDLHRDSTGERYIPDESDYGWTQRPLANTKGD